MLKNNLYLYLIVLLLIFIPLYPKFPLVGVAGTFVSVRLEDFLIALVFLIFLQSFVSEKFKTLTNPVCRSIIVYLIIGTVATFLGIFLTKSTTLGLGTLHLLRRFEYMLLFPVAFFAINAKEQASLVVRVTLLVALLVSLYGVGQQYLNFPVISTNNSEFSKGLALSLGPGARINSTFAGHYDLAAYSVFPLLLIIGLLSLKVRHKYVLYPVGALVYWIVLQSASRITFASFFVCATVLVWMLKKQSWIFPLTLMAIVGFLISPQLRGRYLQFITTRLGNSEIVSTVHAQKDVSQTPDALKPPAQPEDRSLNIRLNAEWPKAIRAFEKDVLLGTGFSSVGLAVDNDYLRALAETGLLGLISFILIFYRYFKTTLLVVRNYTPTIDNVLILVVSCSLLSLIINAVFIDVFAASKVAIFTWIMLGITEKLKLLTHEL